MFTKTFTIERHIEELRAELRGTADAEEARDDQGRAGRHASGRR